MIKKGLKLGWSGLAMALIGSPFWLWPLIAQAQILPACTATGNCGICDFLDTFVNITQWLLGIVAGAALVLMVWHGFTWITAGGSSEKVDSGRKGMTHAVLGMLIVLAAWQLVNITIVILVNPPDGVNQNLFNGPNTWHEYCSGGGNVCLGKSLGSPCGNGQFCKNSNTGLTCDTGTVGIVVAGVPVSIEDPKNACEFWAKYPEAAMGGHNPYKDYACLPAGECNPYENLGTAYCPPLNNAAQSCCLNIQPADSMQ
ncbi:MAG TPA: hypothetical protein DEB69_03845 [Candidatus Komeilibacteria bacterium]|nr:hypothetical protein [Candidatus Komeilibacteria bacterium]